jgi:outer membrane protein assembly factor BamE (lipoprotein component of BamABCDE complex)
VTSAAARLAPAIGACLIGICMAVSACSPRIDQRGNKPDEDLIVQINPGVDDKYRVAEVLGTPSAITTFGDKVWYYISKRTETTAFLEPETVDQEVLEIQFDDQDVVKALRVYGPEDAREVALVERETPTEGNELTILQQLLGNLGRFNPTGDDAAAPY